MSSKSTITIRAILTIEEMLPHLPLIRQLTPNLSLERYKELLDLMVPHNYSQVAAYEGEECVGVSGYWIAAKLYCGKYIEVDNFVVDEKYRSKGVGKMLLDWMLEEGKRRGCDVAMLDAYVQNFRGHAFYYRQGFIGEGVHYVKELSIT